MKVLALILFALSTVVTAPSVCAHALGAADAAAAADASRHDAAPAHAHHQTGGDAHSHQSHDDPTPSATSPQHDGQESCPDGCSGGAGCDGCVAAMSALPAYSDDEMRAVYFSSALPFAKSRHTERAFAVDPPPPRVAQP
ncbi:MAG: hypothetical protein ACX939_07060 [Hyphococcus sp.]